jgi:hypothetical protein
MVGVARIGFTFAGFTVGFKLSPKLSPTLGADCLVRMPKPRFSGLNAPDTPPSGEKYMHMHEQ